MNTLSYSNSDNLKNRAQKLLNYLGNVLVNGPLTPLATDLKPAEVHPAIPETPPGKDST